VKSRRRARTVSEVAAAVLTTPIASPAGPLGCGKKASDRTGSSISTAPTFETRNVAPSRRASAREPRRTTTLRDGGKSGSRRWFSSMVRTSAWSARTGSRSRR